LFEALNFLKLQWLSLKIVSQEDVNDLETNFGSEDWLIQRKEKFSKKNEKQKELDQKLFDELFTGNNDELVAIELINEGATNDYCNGDGWTALHWACFTGKDSVVVKILEKYPEEIEAKRTRSTGFRTPIGAAFEWENYKTAKLLLKKGANNVIWNLLLSDWDYPSKLKLIENNRNMKNELNDLIEMEKVGLLKGKKYINKISSLIEYYKNNEKIRNCIETTLAKCNLFRSIDTSLQPLLWHYDKTFLAS
jgi:ankyrin repeat protein